MQRVRLTRALFIEDAERAAFQLARAASERGRVVLDLEGVTAFRPGAAARLANPLRSAAAAGCDVEVLLPDTEGPLHRILAAGIGPQLAQHSTTLRSGGRARTRELRQVLSAVPQLPETTLLAPDLHRHPTFVARDRASIAKVLRSWLQGFPAGRGRVPNSDELRCVATLVAEAVANVQDHSRKKPLSADARVHSYAQFRWRSRSELTSLSNEEAPGSDPSTAYLSALLADESPWGALGGLLEIEIVDDGVGIASRHALDTSVVEAQSMDREREVLGQALTAGESVKLRAQDCPVDKKPGYGSALVAQQISLMGGYVSLRTGRLIASLQGASREEFTFAIGPGRLAVMPGCIVTALLPVFAKARPMQVADDDPQPRLF